jgi:hypothetical protein
MLSRDDQNLKVFLCEKFNSNVKTVTDIRFAHTSSDEVCDEVHDDAKQILIMGLPLGNNIVIFLAPIKCLRTSRNGGALRRFFSFCREFLILCTFTDFLHPTVIACSE